MLRRFASTAAAKMSVGAKFPAVTLFEGTPGGAVPMAELLKGKKVVVLGVPGAFTPGCSATHLPGYVKNAAAFKVRRLRPCAAALSPLTGAPGATAPAASAGSAAACDSAVSNDDAPGKL